MWLNNFFLFRSEKLLGVILVINSFVLPVLVAMTTTERPLFLYKKAEGKIEMVRVEHISYTIKTSISYNSTVIHYKNNYGGIDKLIFGEKFKDEKLLSKNDQIKAWYYTRKGYKKIKQLIVNGKTVRKYNETVGISVCLGAIISLIFEILFIKMYRRNFVLSNKNKTKKKKIY